jgi:hypothetical protein
MIGLSILLAVIAYIWLAGFVAKRIKNRTAKYFVIALFVLVPTWDVIPGKIYFNHLCEREAGLKIYKVVNDVEGFRVYPGAAESEPDALKKYGYKFQEKGSGNGFVRFTLDAQGKVVEQKITESIARYAVDATDWMPLAWGVKKSEVYIFDQQTKERLAVITSFSAGGSWIIRMLFDGAPSGAGYCGGAGWEFYLNTLKPDKSSN